MKTFNSLSLATSSVALALGLIAGASSISLAQTAAPTASPAATSTAVANASQPARGGYMKMLKQMGLTPAQEAQIKPLMKSQKMQIDAIKANTALTDQQRKQQMRQVRQATLTSIRADLTPAQQQSLDTYMAQQKAERKAARVGSQP